MTGISINAAGFENNFSSITGGDTFVPAPAWYDAKAAYYAATGNAQGYYEALGVKPPKTTISANPAAPYNILAESEKAIAALLFPGLNLDTVGAGLGAGAAGIGSGAAALGAGLGAGAAGIGVGLGAGAQAAGEAAKISADKQGEALKTQAFGDLAESLGMSSGGLFAGLAIAAVGSVIAFKLLK